MIDNYISQNNSDNILKSVICFSLLHKELAFSLGYWFSYQSQLFVSISKGVQL